MPPPNELNAENISSLKCVYAETTPELANSDFCVGDVKFILQLQMLLYHV